MTEKLSLHTKRLLLKSISPQHIHEAFESLNKNEIMKMFGLDEKRFEFYKQMHEGGMKTYNTSLHFFLLVDKKGGQIIGDCGFHSWNFIHNKAELFYNIYVESFKQKGLISEALSAVIEFGFLELNLHRIQGMVADSNKASVRLLKKNGFTKEGTIREDYIVDGKNEDSDCYSILKWEWEQNMSRQK